MFGPVFVSGLACSPFGFNMEAICFQIQILTQQISQRETQSYRFWFQEREEFYHNSPDSLDY